MQVVTVCKLEACGESNVNAPDRFSRSGEVVGEGNIFVLGAFVFEGEGKGDVSFCFSI